MTVHPKIAPLVQKPAARFRMTAGISNPIPTGRTTVLTSINRLVCVKPDVTLFPPQACTFYVLKDANGTLIAPTSLDQIYETASADFPTSVNVDHAGWPSTANKTVMDVNLKSLGFTTGQNVAIAFNLDSQVNGGDYYYSFYCGDPTSFDPQQAITEGDSLGALSWIQGDDFQRGVINVSGSPVGKTVVVVCPVTTAGPAAHFIPFNVSILAVRKTDQYDSVPATFDPKIKNNG